MKVMSKEESEKLAFLLIDNDFGDLEDEFKTPVVLKSRVDYLIRGACIMALTKPENLRHELSRYYDRRPEDLNWYPSDLSKGLWIGIIIEFLEA